MAKREQERNRSNAAKKAAETKGARRRSNDAKKAAETKGPAERSRAAKMARWTRQNGKDDAANPHSRENEGKA
jgi:hypothetical protein